MRIDPYAGSGTATRAGWAVLRMMFAVSISVLGAVGVADAQEETLQEEPLMESRMPGQLTGTGTQFQVADSPFLNISLTSSQPVSVMISSVPETVSLQIESAGEATSADIVLGGLNPLTTYHKYEDDLHNHVVFTSDENGQYSYHQDLSKTHLIFIQTTPSTLFISDNATGGDCAASIGNWDAPTKTCTMTHNLLGQTVQISSNGITLDGDGYIINHGGWGVYVYGMTGVTVKNIDFVAATSSVYLYQSSNNIVENNSNEFTYSGYPAINLQQSHNNIIRNNTVTASYAMYGIYINQSNNNSLTGNSVSNSQYGFGILLYQALQTTLQNNVMSNNKYNFGIEGNSAGHFDSHTIDTSNLVNGKPVYYVLSASGQTFDASTNAGVFYCIYCDDVTIKDLTFEHNDWGLLFWGTQNSTVDNVQALNDYFGIGLGGNSTGNRLSNSTASDDQYAIQLSGSHGNTLIGNQVDNNTRAITLGSSNNNVLKKNTVDSNFRGIDITGSLSQYNRLELNDVTNNSYRGLFLQGQYSAVTANNFNGNDEYAIEIPTGGHYNTISCNTFSNNYIGMSIGYTTLYNEIFNNNFLTSTYSHVLESYDSYYETFSFAPPIGGNYWDDYDTPGEGCTDLDMNGFCDAPRVILAPQQDDYPWTIQNGWVPCAISGSADLSVTKTADPEPVIAGDDLTYTITVTNNGPDDATDVTVTDPLPGSTSFVSAVPSQGVCSGTSTVVCDLGTLANGAVATVTITVTTIAAGGISNTATVAGNESDPNTANDADTAGTTVNPANGPDLIMTAVTPNASTVNQGGTLSADDTVMNQGVDPAGVFRIAYRLSLNTVYGDGDDVVISTIRTVTSLAAGGSNSATTNLSIPSTAPGGDYHLCALADSIAQVAESDETNNALCSSGTVTLPSIDLVMTAVSTGTTVIAPGKTLPVSTTVMNQGGYAAGSFRIGFYLSVNSDGSTLDQGITATRPVSSLAGGAFSTGTTTVAIPSTTAEGSYYICAVADSLLQVAETDEGNNVLCTGTTVQVALPDLSMTDVTPNSGTANPGGTLSVTSTVSNGGSASGVFRIAFRLSLNTVYGDSDDVVITVTRVVISLAPGASSTGTTNLTLPGSTASGNYHVCALADSLNQVNEGNEGNNTLCSVSTVNVP